MTNTFNFSTKTILGLLFLFIISAPAANAQSQIHEMSIPYNQDWEICDTPIAKYYRVGKLVTGSKSFFTGLIKDYYKDGHLQMQGTYDENGLKQGMFIYYHPNGKVERRGKFENNQMQGLWSYYNKEGERFLAILCEGEDQFTPLFFVNAKGDTTLENGTGKFELSIDQYKPIFQAIGTVNIRYMSGACVNGKREGVWKYYGDHEDKRADRIQLSQLNFDETYQAGKMLKKASYVEEPAEKKIPESKSIVRIYPTKHQKVDSFGSDFAFQEAFGSWNNAYSYLFTDSAPTIVSASKSPENNMKDFVNCIQRAVELTEGYETDHIPYVDLDQNYWVLFNSIRTAYPDEAVPPSREGDIHFIVSKEGETKDIRIEGSLSSDLKKTIVYYLSLLKDLHRGALAQEQVVHLKLVIRHQAGNYKGISSFTEFGIISRGDDNYNFARATVERGEIILATSPVFGKNEKKWFTYFGNTLLALPDFHGFGEFKFEYLVNEDGTVSDIKSIDLVNSYSPSTFKALKDLAGKSPRLTPAMLQGKPIKYQQKITLSLSFGGEVFRYTPIPR